MFAVGHEVAGVVDGICNTLASDASLKKGDRVIMYPDNQESLDGG